MKKVKALIYVMAFAAVVTPLLIAQGSQEERKQNQSQGQGMGPGQGQGNQSSSKEALSEMETLLKSFPAEDLSNAEKEGLILMREEEKLARDVYRVLYEKWGINVFNNISLSEESHMAWIKVLLSRYGVEDPVEIDTPGKFENPEMQKLYNEMTKEGLESLEKALIMGATVEDLDIYDLQTLLKDADNQDVRVLYHNLIKGSRNHMRAFYRQIDRQGSTYQAQYISSDYLTKILASQQEQFLIDSPDFSF